MKTEMPARHTTVVRDADLLLVTYHNTLVVEHDYKSRATRLNTGGFRTATTKSRMNDAAEVFGLGFRVFQDDFDWYIETNEGTAPFPGNTAYIRNDCVYDINDKPVYMKKKPKTQRSL